MNRIARTSMIGAAAIVSAMPLAAQQATPKVFDVTPYAGYMMFGKLFEGPIGTSVSAGSGPVYGAQMSLTMAKNVALYGNVGYSSSDLKIGLPIIGGLDVGSSKALMYDGGVELKIPMQAASVVTPFVQGGVGAIRYEVESGFLNANATNVAYNVGGGVDVRLSPNFGVRVMAKDYLGKFDFKEATTFNVNGKTTNNVALTLGVNFGF
jgi:Outer membrane protein beta-barrel domain